MISRSTIIPDSIRAAASPFDRRMIWEWAQDNVNLTGAYRHTGRFSIAHSPQLREPLEQLHNPKVRVISCRFPVRAGKSLLGDLMCLWVPVNAPGPLLWNLQTDPLARIHCKTRIWPNIMRCEPVLRLLPEDRHAKNIREIHFRNGMPLYVQGPALRSLQGRGVRFLINDECHTYEPGRLAEAMARTGDFDEIDASKTLNLSQGSEADDDCDRDYTEGDCREWEVQCQNCNEYFRPTAEWNRTRGDGEKIGLVFEESDELKDPVTGLPRISDTLKTVRFRCPTCLHLYHDSKQTRYKWNHTGRYVATNPNSLPNHVSFHFEATITRSWRSLAEEYIKAVKNLKSGNIEPMRIYVQKRRALSWSELMLFAANPPKTFVIESDWKDEAGRIMSIDRQTQGVYWVTARQWAVTGESRRLFFGRLHGEAELVAKQEELQINSACVFIDAGNEAHGDDGVFAMCIRHGWIALIGDDRKQFLHPGRDRYGRAIAIPRSYSRKFYGDPHSGTRRAKQTYAECYRWSNPSIRNRLQQLIDRGLWKEPPMDDTDEMELEYRRQMGAVQMKEALNKRTGRTEIIWYERSKNNHAHDCACMQLPGALAARWLPDGE